MEPFVQPLHCHRNTVTDRYKDGDQSHAPSPLRAQVATIQQETGEWLLESELQQELKHQLIYCLYAAANIAAALPHPGAPQR